MKEQEWKYELYVTVSEIYNEVMRDLVTNK